eukprot:Anaeramoba_ignava/a90148_68.p1 GENE.a90148_68~~a90148_68.p1  ORF type:complete len:206 (-),score=78.33 a90148_68:59-649(-)
MQTQMNWYQRDPEILETAQILVNLKKEIQQRKVNYQPINEEFIKTIRKETEEEKQQTERKKNEKKKEEEEKKKEEKKGENSDDEFLFKFRNFVTQNPPPRVGFRLSYISQFKPDLIHGWNPDTVIHAKNDPPNQVEIEDDLFVMVEKSTGQSKKNVRRSVAAYLAKIGLENITKYQRGKMVFKRNLNRKPLQSKKI